MFDRRASAKLIMGTAGSCQGKLRRPCNLSFAKKPNKTANSKHKYVPRGENDWKEIQKNINSDYVQVMKG